MFPIDVDVAQRAKTILLGKYGLSARDAIHLAVMETHATTATLKFWMYHDTCYSTSADRAATGLDRHVGKPPRDRAN